MAEVGSVTVAVVPTFTGFRSKLSAEADGAGKESGNAFASGFKGIVGPAIAAIGAIGFGSLIAEAARASDATDKFKSTMNFAGIDTSGIESATKAAKAYADQTVYDLPTIQATMAQLASNGVTNYTELTQAAGNLNAVAGGNAETFKSVSRTLTQSAGAGKLMTEDWNMLADAIPGASGPLQKVMKEAGAFQGNFKDAMAAGEISSQEFQDALSKLGNDPIAVEAARSVTTFEGALGNLSATVNSGLMSALDALKPAITGAINGVSSALGSVFTFFGGLFTGLKSLFLDGDITPALLTSLGLSEDSPIIAGLFWFQDRLYAAYREVSDFIAGFTMPDDMVTQYAGMFTRSMEIGIKIRDGIQATFKGISDFVSGFTMPINLAEQFAGEFNFMQSLGLTVRDAFGQIGSAIGPLIPNMVALWQATSPLQIVFAAIQPLLPQLLGMFGQLASVVGGSLMSVLTSLVPMLVSLSAVISQSLGSMLAAVLPTAVQMITMLGTTISQLLPIIMPIIATIIQLATTLISQLAPIITNLVSSILPPLVDIFGNILSAIGPLISTIAGLLIPIIQALMPVVVTVFSVVADVIKNAMQIIQGIIQVVTGVISGDWSQVWEGIGNIFGGIWNTIVSVVKGALQLIGQVVISGLGLVGNFVGSTLEGIGRFFSDTWNNITRGVGGFIDGFLGFFRDLPGKIVSALSGAGTWLLGIGKNIIDGLINGITGMAGTVARAILNLVPEAIRGPIEAALGIHSPSRVAMWWGHMIGDGLSGGIDDSQRKVASSMGSLVSIPNVTGAVGSTAAGIGGGQVNNFTINQVDDPIGTSTAVARRLRAVSV